jgi:dTDP-4-dehydrorhamnose 3,5-epimerase-like enzyme
MDGPSAGTDGPAKVGVFTDSRGTLTLVEAGQIPFVPRRTYLLHDMPPGAVRGGHGNREQNRLLVGISGRSAVTLDDGRRTREVSLLVGQSLLIEPSVWHEIEICEADTAILVFADGDFDPDDMFDDRSVLPFTL